MDQNKNRRVALLITFSALILLIACAAAAPLLLSFLAGILTGACLSLITFAYWLIKG